MDDARKILIVDDDDMNRRVLSGFLRSMGHDPVVATGGEEALEMLDPGIDLILLDAMMPDMDGFELTKRIRLAPGMDCMPIIFVTALDSREDRLRAVQAGANDFIAKPIDATELQVRADSLLKMKQSRDAVKRYQNELEGMVKVRTEALEIALDNLRSQQKQTHDAYLGAIHCLAAAAEFKDEETGSHLSRMSRYSALISRTLGHSKAVSDLILVASPMHDVGKIGVPDAILLKPGKLDAGEWEVMKRHTLIGARILGDSTSEILEAARVIALSHHEKYDGSGYPKGLAGEDIPLYGRICAVADVFDALTSKRPYKEPYSTSKSLEILREGRGGHFDPRVLDAFLDNLDQVREIQTHYSE